MVLKGALALEERVAEAVIAGRLRLLSRGRTTRVRGRVVVVSGDSAVGSVSIIGVRTVPGEKLPELLKGAPRRLIERYQDWPLVYLWILDCPARYREPVPVSRRRGQSLWVRLTRQEWERILAEEERAVPTGECRLHRITEWASPASEGSGSPSL